MIRQFSISESGGATGWGLFILACIIVVAGLAIDGTNGMRAKEHLQSTADIAAHAGAVELANGSANAKIGETAKDIAQLNMPVDSFGDVVGDAQVSVQVGHFDGTNFSAGVHTRNAVRVDLEMTESSGNPVETFLLGLVGHSSWDVRASSMVSYDDTGLCDSNDGIYAHGTVKITSSATIGTDFCIFSKQAVELSNNNEFATGSHIAMPDLENCKHCTDHHNPGVEDAKLESNLQLEDVSQHIDAIMASFLRTSGDQGPVNDFTGVVSLDSDLTPLSDIDYNTALFKEGDIVSISATDFEALPSVPSGLVYAVYCSAPLVSSGAHTPESSSNTNGGSQKTSTKKGGSSPSKLSFETSSSSGISGVAVMTDCQLDFGNTAIIRNSIIVTTSTSNQSVSAGSKAVIGSSAISCPNARKVVIMSQGDMRIPAGLETNNVDFIIAGDVNLASGTSAQATKLGTSIYIGGEAQIAAQGTWIACGDAKSELNPDVKVIRHVVEVGTQSVPTQ